MRRKQIFKIRLWSLLLTTCLIFSYGCSELFSPSDLNINHVGHEEIQNYKTTELPDGSYIPDNPNFDFNDPETWTGNMAQYVKHNYLYSVTFEIKNKGAYIAYDSEVDLHYFFDNGDEIVETIYIGEIKGNKSISRSTTFLSTNKKLIECSAEVFWTD